MALVVGAVVVSTAVAKAQATLDFDLLLTRPDFQVTRKIENGEEVLEARQGTVTFRKTKAGVVGHDDSIPVLCAWEQYVTFKILADACLGDQDAELKQDLDAAVRRLNLFIVANSVTPVAVGSLEERMEERRRRAAGAAAILPKGLDGRPVCPRNETLEAFRSDGHGRRLAEIDRIVAVPRPPVLSPCF